MKCTSNPGVRNEDTRAGSVCSAPGKHNAPRPSSTSAGVAHPRRAVAAARREIDPRTPVIVGVGLRTSLGNTLEETWQSLLAGRYIEDHARAVDRSGGRDGRGESRSRVAQLACDAVADASSIALPDVIRHSSDDRTALIVGTSKGPVESWLDSPAGSFKKQREMAGGFAGESSATLHGWGLSELDADVAAFAKIGGPRLTLSAACASGLHALARAALMVRSGEADRVLVVAAEASVHPLFLATFSRLGVLPKAGVGCRPFDEDREGFLISDAAAAVWVTAAGLIHERSIEPPLRPLRIEQCAIAGDAYHLTAGDAGARVLRRLLHTVIDHKPVDLIHAHGTGTVLNDPAELAAIEAVLDERPKIHGSSLPAMYSHKGALGHTLGASGLVAVVLNWKSHHTGIVAPNVRTTSPLLTQCVSLRTGTDERPVHRSIAIAAGFGGAMGAVSLASD